MNPTIRLASIALALASLSPLTAYDVYTSAQIGAGFKAASFDRMVSDDCRTRGLNPSDADDRALVAVALVAEAHGASAAWLCLTGALQEAA